MRSPFIAAVAALLLVIVAGCAEVVAPPPGNPTPIIVREFAVSPGIVTLDPSFGFSLRRGERGVPRSQRAAGLGRAVAFNLADAMTESLTRLGYSVIRSENATAEPGARALIVSGAFRRIDEGNRRRVGAENSGVTVDLAIDYQAYGMTPQRLAVLQLDSRQLGGERLVAASARQRGDVKIAASQLGAAIGRYVGEAARLQKWPAAAH